MVTTKGGDEIGNKTGKSTRPSYPEKIEHDWVIRSTFFGKPIEEQMRLKNHATTGWDSTVSNSVEQIDCILIPRQRANAIQDVETDMWASLHTDQVRVRPKTKQKNEKEEACNESGNGGHQTRRRQQDLTKKHRKGEDSAPVK